MPHRWLKSLHAHFEPVPVADPLWRRGLTGCPIERYAAESASEYFAVVSELHYSQPRLLRQSEPPIASLLETFYGRSPAIGCEPDHADHRVSSLPASR